MRVLPFFKPKKGWHVAGTNLETDSGGGSYVLPKASAETLGGVKVGNNLSIDGDGVLSASGGGSYVLPKASAETLGGVKVGNNLSIDENGVLSASGGSGGGFALDTTEHEIGTFGNRKLFSKTLYSAVPHSATSANIEIENATTNFETMIGFFGNFIAGNSIHVAVTQCDYDRDYGSFHIMGLSPYSGPTDGKVYVTIFYTKTGQ